MIAHKSGQVLFLHNGKMGKSHPAQPHVLDPSIFFEKPERLQTFISVAEQFSKSGVVVESCERLVSREVLELVHSPRFLEEFERTKTLSDGSLIEFGSEFFVSAATWDAACSAIGCAVEGIERLLENEIRHVVCGARPPGHHARPHESMGFCGLSTAAIAAMYARSWGGKSRRVCVFDYDVHSGNGTIESLLGQSGVLFCEIRTMTVDAVDTPTPFRAYPYPSGSTQDERYWYAYLPAGNNLILEDMFLGTTGGEYMARFREKILPPMQEFRPDLIILSAGFDCMKGDPLGDLGVDPHDIQSMVRMIADIGVPTLTVIEGGYDLENLRSGLAGHFSGLL